MAKLSQIEEDKLKIDRAKAALARTGKAASAFRRRLAEDSKLSRFEQMARRATAGPLKRPDSRIAPLSRMMDKIAILAALALVGSTVLLYLYKGRD